MYKTYDDVNGYPPRLYRSHEEIKNDISAVKLRICEINSMLNIRELLSDAFDEEKISTLPERAESIGELLKFAEEALGELSELSKTLDELREELRCAREAARA